MASVCASAAWPVNVRNTSSSVGVRSVRSRTFTPQVLSATATGLMSAAPLVAAVAAAYDVADLSIQEPAIEDVIRSLYGA